MTAPNAVEGVKGFVSIPLADRFWAKVDKRGPDECWPWLGSFDAQKNRYPSLRVDGHHRKASQISWELASDVPFPPGMMACHTCDNIACVNPGHIFPGTMSDNQRDSVSKGRNDPLNKAYWTHCSYGHEYTPENTIVRSTGHRTCRECQRRRNAARRKS